MKEKVNASISYLCFVRDCLQGSPDNFATQIFACYLSSDFQKWIELCHVNTAISMCLTFRHKNQCLILNIPFNIIDQRSL